MARAAESLLARQKPQGFWCGELTADTTLVSDYILLQLWLHQPKNGAWTPPSRDRIQRACRSILERQLPDGGFNIYPGGPAEINATVKAYCALKLAGLDARSLPLRRARRRVLALGGLQSAHSYVKIHLSLFGLYPRQATPSVPAELPLLSGRVLYKMASWTRSILVLLAILQARGANRRAPAGFTVNELLRPQAELEPPRHNLASVLFGCLDRAWKVWEKPGPRRVRDAAIRRAERWVHDRAPFAEGFGAIFPGMMYGVMALDALGYPLDHPQLAAALRHFEALLVETGDRLDFQLAVSPVWDTALSAFALAEAGRAVDEPLTRAADWLINLEVRHKGDWSVKRPATEPSGWAFQFHNDLYPDSDDTAMVLLALDYAQGSDPQPQAAAERRALRWLLAMQSKDGGWAAFDVDNNSALLRHVPFADGDIMLDPTCPDITGRVLESLCRRGLSQHPAVRRGVAYLIRSQRPDGSWYGRWGVNYLYGTFLAMRGLAASVAPRGVNAIARAAEWLRSVQNPDGGWGESCASYSAGCFVAAASCPSQTAWAILGLQAAGQRRGSAADRGLEFLLARQNPNGAWTEDASTGTGIPNMFYMNFGMYRDYFPLLALAGAWRSGP